MWSTGAAPVQGLIAVFTGTLQQMRMIHSPVRAVAADMPAGESAIALCLRPASYRYPCGFDPSP
ncbi:hypothetical protein AURDEDRAFT_115583 [Auricularia subglabra TFB-10046 SS5]|nr:hypothetical protein AURDEDRAFT_115583 [Auricularia subglabra TFB-10046 SS5]